MKRIYNVITMLIAVSLFSQTSHQITWEFNQNLTGVDSAESVLLIWQGPDTTSMVQDTVAIIPNRNDDPVSETTTFLRLSDSQVFKGQVFNRNLWGSSGSYFSEVYPCAAPNMPTNIFISKIE